MKKSILIIIPYLLLAGSVIFFKKHEQKILQRSQLEIMELKQQLTEQRAKYSGLQEANVALHRQLAIFRATPPEVNPEPPIDLVAEEEKIEDNQEMQNLQKVEDVVFSPESATTAPNISPQLREMMNQFPGQVSEDSISNRNTIQEYFDANPQIAEEINKPSGTYGSGIQDVIDRDPNMAEKIKKNTSFLEQPGE